jgi:N-acetylated-alpha-linked acidic dipeptidase
MTKYAGDPLTPGLPATRDAKRLALPDVSTLPRVPTAPISSEDAAPILKHLGGPEVPKDWQGGLPFPYHLGPGPAKVRLRLKMDFQVRPIWNVIANIQGAREPENSVILGSHRDAWTYGAADPLSGTTCLLAVARGLGELMKQGWKPVRTVILASWDGEEFGLIGSTEWAEEHAGELGCRAVAYLNTDVAVSGGHFQASAVPSLRGLVREVAREIVDPKTEKPLYDVWVEESAKSRSTKEAGPVVPVPGGDSDAEGVSIGELGAGSDYVSFLQHLGIPSLDFGFVGPYGVYHSIYDNFYWMEHFGDPTFKYNVAAAQILGTLAMRLADADILPFDYEEYARAMEGYLDTLEKETGGRHRGELRLPLELVRAATARFSTAARRLNEKIKDVTEHGFLPADRLAALNQKLFQVERCFLLEPGLPGRDWFRHAFYAPGVYTGYAAVVLPGVHEALDRDDAKAAAEQIEQVRSAIERGTGALDEASAAVGEAAGVERAPQGSTAE